MSRGAEGSKHGGPLMKRVASVRRRELGSLVTAKLEVFAKGELATALRLSPRTLLVVHTSKDKKKQRAFSENTKHHLAIQQANVLLDKFPVVVQLTQVYEKNGLLLGKAVEVALGRPLHEIKRTLTKAQAAEVIRQLRRQTQALHDKGFYHGGLIGGENVNVEIIDGEVAYVRMYNPQGYENAEDGQRADSFALNALDAYIVNVAISERRRQALTDEIKTGSSETSKDL